MAKSKFTPDARAAILTQLLAGATLADACARADVALTTVHAWLARGRRDQAGAHFEFALAVAGARAAREDTELSPDQYLEHLAKAVRSGSVQAMKLWWDIHRREEPPKDPDGEPEDPFAALDGPG